MVSAIESNIGVPLRWRSDSLVVVEFEGIMEDVIVCVCG